MMKRLASIRFYALAVCFVSVICIAITTGFALYNLMTLAAPQLTIDPLSNTAPEFQYCIYPVTRRLLIPRASTGTYYWRRVRAGTVSGKPFLPT